jgi:hypothetical protein
MSAVRLSACLVLFAAAALAAPATRTVYISATDAKGDFVTDLTIADVSVTENEKPREITELLPATEVCHVAILVDDGGDGLMQGAVAELLNAMGDRGAFAIYLLNPQAAPLNDYTNSHAMLQQSVAKLIERGRLSRDPLMLADGIAWVARDMLKRKLSRPVIVTLTNAGDTEERAHQDAAKDILEDLRTTGVALHVIHVVGAPLGQVLVDGPPQSGGSSAVSTSTSGFAKAMTAIAQTLAHQYKLTYALPPDVKPGERLRVVTSRPQVKIVAPTRVPTKLP